MGEDTSQNNTSRHLGQEMLRMVDGLSGMLETVTGGLNGDPSLPSNKI